MSDMRTSSSGLAFIARWEGTRLRVYEDAAGKATIGVGHLLRAGEAFPDGITQEQALELLATDVGIAEHAVNSHVSADVGQNAFDAMVSLAFNIGGQGFATSSVCARLNAGDAQGAADAFLLWDRRQDPKSGTLVEDGGLLSRRRAERALFLTPD